MMGPIASIICLAATHQNTPIKPINLNGTWQFSECWKAIDADASNCVEYRIKFLKSQSNIFAEISIDGFQSLRRMRCIVYFEKSIISLKLDRFKPNDVGLKFKRYATLLQLRATNDPNKFEIIWKDLSPVLDQNKINSTHLTRTSPKPNQ